MKTTATTILLVLVFLGSTMAAKGEFYLPERVSEQAYFTEQACFTDQVQECSEVHDRDGHRMEKFKTASHSDLLNRSETLGGGMIPSTDTVRVLLVFAKFPDDTTNPHWDLWPLSAEPDPRDPYQIPSELSWMSRLIETDPADIPNIYENITNFFYQSSGGRYFVIGDVIYVNADTTYQYYLDHFPNLYSRRMQAHRDLFKNVIYKKLGSGIRDYDNWSSREMYQHSKEPDGFLDMVPVLWRTPPDLHRSRDLGGVNNWFGHWHGTSSLVTGHYLLNDDLKNPLYVESNSGFTVHWSDLTSSFEILIHEYSHHLISGPGTHPYPQGSGLGYSGWSLMANNKILLSVNSHERMLLGWYDEVIDLKEGFYYIEDFFDRHSNIYRYAFNEHEILYLENRNKLRQNLYDQATLNDEDRGIHFMAVDLSHEFGYLAGLRENIIMHHYVSDGNWDWHFDELSNACQFVSSVGKPVFQRKNENPFGVSLKENINYVIPGQGAVNDMIFILDDAPPAPGDSFSCVEYHKGFGHIFSFNEHTDAVISPYTNPGFITPGNRYSNLRIDILESGGTAKIRVSDNYGDARIKGGAYDYRLFWGGDIEIREEVSIDKGGHLTILPGTNVKMGPDAALIVSSEGAVSMSGTQADPVRFERLVGGMPWSGIRFEGKNNSLAWMEVAGGPVSIGKDSKVAVSGVLSIEESSILKMDSGARLVMAAGSEIHSAGIFYANADANNPAVITGSGDDDWNGLFMEGDNHYLNQVVVRGGNVVLYQSAGSTIRNSVFENNYSGLRLYNIRNTEISGNVFRANQTYGLVSFMNADRGNVIRDNIMDGNGRGGVFLWNSEVHQFEGNRIENNMGFGIRIMGHSFLRFQASDTLSYGDEGVNRMINNANHPVYISNSSQIHSGDVMYAPGHIAGFNVHFHYYPPGPDHSVGVKKPADLSLYERVMQIINELSEVSSDPFTASKLNELHILTLLDYHNELEDPDKIDEVFAYWASYRGVVPFLFHGEEAEWVQLATETAMMIEAKRKYQRDRRDEVGSLTEEFGPYIYESDHRISFKELLINLAAQIHMYNAGWVLFDQIEKSAIENESVSDYGRADYRPLSDYLAWMETKYKTRDGWLFMPEPGSVPVSVPDRGGNATDRPDGFGLMANAPNPFNYGTWLTFSLGERARVRLTVYDVSGRQVAFLAHQEYNSGIHRIHFDAAELSSGIYLVKAEMEPDHGAARQFVRKITLIK